MPHAHWFNMKIINAAAVLALSAFASVTLQAIPIEGAKIIVATDGEVIATYRGNSASYSNDLYLDSPANAIGIIFNNHASPVGSTKSLGSFTAGTELVFRLHVNNTGNDFFSGPADRNPDNHAHAQLDDSDPLYPNETVIHFEDLFNGPFQYNDLSFSFSNVRAVDPTTDGVPDGGITIAMLGLGFAGMSILRKK